MQEKLRELGSFEWSDNQSEDLLASHGRQVVKKPETVIPGDMIKYTGEWAGEERHGRGTQIWADGARYDGYFVNGEQEGFGRIIHADGDYYIGYW